MIKISSDIESRYSRFNLISWWEQGVLKKSKVLVIGCGALGNEIIKNLAMLGIGNIFAVDMDKVEKSNLSRSILFRREDEGKFKAEVVCKRAKEINEEIKIKYFNGNVFELGLGIFKDMDIIICGLDNREARLFVNQSCWKVNRPWIDGAIETLNGVARMFVPPDGVCYECTMNDTDYKLLNKRKSCLLLGLDDIQQGKIPTTPTISSIIAGIQVQEAVKYLHGKEFESLSGKGFIYNGINNESYTVEYQKNGNCPSHYTFMDFKKAGKKFSSTELEDVLDFGRKYYKGRAFEIEFNNEVIYSLCDERGKDFDYHGNMNLMTLKDIKKKDKFYKMNSFHRLDSESDLTKKMRGKKLIDLKIPYNDIITLRRKDNEIHIEFDAMKIFI